MEPMANQGIMRKEPIVVTSADGLELLAGLIHDEFFELKDVSFSREEGIVTIPYRRVFHGHPGRRTSNWFLWATYEVDVIRSELVIRNVAEYSVNDRSGIGTYSFCTVSYGGGALAIDCCEALEMTMVVSDLYIESRDLEVRGKVSITRGLLGTLGPGKVRE